MNKKTKIRMDRKTLKAYDRKLRARRKEYEKQAEAFSMTDRRSRAACAGECLLQAMEQLQQLNREKKLVNGTLWWSVGEQRVKDTDGKKGFRYTVAWHVLSDEAYYTEEEILKELRDTYRRLREETEEMYGEVTDEEYLEEDGEPPAGM